MRNYNDTGVKESILGNYEYLPIDIVVVTYNRLPYLMKCIWSIVAATEVPYRIFVIDDHSNDGTQEWLVKMRNRGVVHAITLNKENKGTAHCFNDIIGATRSDWFAMCNDDMYFHRSWDFACMDVIKRDDENKIGAINFFDYSRYALDEGVDEIADDLLSIQRAGLGAAMINRFAFNKAKGFDLPKGKKMGYMTTPFCNRLKKLKFDILGLIPHYVTNMDVVGSKLNEFEYLDKGDYFDHRAKEKNFVSKNRKNYKTE